MAEYWELLRDPRWQEKRLRIMERAGFKCERCGSSNRTLNVHHSYYMKGAAPWEYPDLSLHCLCEAKCHPETQAMQDGLKTCVGIMNLPDQESLIGWVLARFFSDHNKSLPCDSDVIAEGFADYWKISKEDVVALVKDRFVDTAKLRELSSAAQLKHDALFQG